MDTNKNRLLLLALCAAMCAALWSPMQAAYAQPHGEHGEDFHGRDFGNHGRVRSSPEHLFCRRPL